MTNVLTLLVLLACPLMMYFCMRGMGKHGPSESSPEKNTQEYTPEEKLAMLRAHQQEIARHIEALQDELESAKGAPIRTSLKEGASEGRDGKRA